MRKLLLTPLGGLVILNGVSFASRADPLRSGSATAVAGGIELDLTDAVPAETATLDLTAFAGGIDGLVPAGWRVEMRPLVVFGGTDNRTDPDAVGKDAPVLVVDARAYLGGISVRAARRQEIRSGVE